MRIAQAIALYLPEFQGGATLVCDRLARALAARGHAVEIFSGRTTAAEPLGALKRDMVGPFLTWRVNLGGAFHPWSRENYANPVAAESFAEFLAATQPDVVHAHSIQALGAGVLHAARDAGVPVVLTMHDWWWLCPCLFRLSPRGTVCSPIRAPRALLGPRRRRLRGPSRGARRGARLRRPDPDPVRLPARQPDRERLRSGPHHGAGERDADPERAARRSGRSRRARPGAAAAGGLPRWRRQSREGLARAPRGGAGAVAARDRARLRRRRRGPGSLAGSLAGRVACHPQFAAGQLDGVLADADVVVIPSLMRESFSLVAREALIRGLPVVISDCGGPEEVVRDGENGLVVPTGVPAALAAALNRLGDDRALLARLASAAPPQLATPDDQAAAAEAIYADVVREAQARRAAAADATPAAEPGGKSLFRRLFDLRTLFGLGSGETGESTTGAADGTRARAVGRRRERRQRTFGAGKRVLFLTGIDGAPLRYRVWHLGEQLAQAGIESRAFYHSDVAALAAARGADCVVLFRAPYSVTVAAVVAEARRRKIPVVFSVDDLVFRTDLLDDAPALGLARPEVVAGFRQSVEAYARSFAAADYFLGSTEHLVQAAQDAGRVSFLHRNGLGSPLLACAERARAAARAASSSNGGGAHPLRIGFLSGTDTHDRDLEAIAMPLRRLLEQSPQVTLVLGGPVALPAALQDLDGRVERWPFVAWSDLPARLATLDVSLAPLELPNAFNQAKSEVKYLEAAAVQVATVASPSEAFRAATRDGTSGLLAADEEEWGRALERLVRTDEERSSLARLARRDVYRRYSPLVQDADLLAIFDEIAERGPCHEGPAPSPIPMEAGGGSCVALEPAAAAYDAYQLDAESGGPLGPGNEVEQEFVCRRDGLRRVDVMVGTYARRNAHRVVLELLDDSGGVRGRREVAGAKLVNQTFVSLALDAPVEDSAGRTFTLRATAPEARAGNEILLWHAPSELEGLRVGGDPIPGRTLTFRSFGRNLA